MLLRFVAASLLLLLAVQAEPAPQAQDGPAFPVVVSTELVQVLVFAVMADFQSGTDGERRCPGELRASGPLRNTTFPTSVHLQGQSTRLTVTLSFLQQAQPVVPKVPSDHADDLVQPHKVRPFTCPEVYFQRKKKSDMLFHLRR